MRAHISRHRRTVAALLAAAIGLSACVSNVRDDDAYYGRTTPLTPAEQRLRAQSNSYARTTTQACVTVGAVAAIAAYMLSDRRHRGRNAAIAGAAGCGAGMGVNHYVQTRRSQYANKEQRMQVMIMDIRKENERLESLVGTTRQVVADDRKRIARIDDAYRSKEISVARARTEMRAVVDNRNHLRQTLDALRQKESDWKKVSIYERHAGSDTRALDAEIQELRRKISTIEEELAVMDQEISVSPVAA